MMIWPGKLWPEGKSPTGCFCKQNLIGTKPCSFLFCPWVLSSEVGELRNCNRLNSLQNLKNYHLYYIYYRHVIFTKKVCQSLQTTSATSLSLGWSALPWSFLCAKGIAGALQYFLILNIITQNTLLKKTGNYLKEQQVLFFIILNSTLQFWHIADTPITAEHE